MIASAQVVRFETSVDLAAVRHAVRSACRALGLTTFQETKALTVCSELARNALQHADGGAMTIRAVQHGKRQGVEMVFDDDGPGFEDIERAMVDGYTTSRGLGLGLGGSKRLADEFEVKSRSAGGTSIRAILFAGRR